MKRILRVFLYLLLSIITILLGLTLYIWAISPGTTEEFMTENSRKPEKSIASIEKIKLGGVEQYLIIRGKDTTKPVVLLLHGGPGSPEVAFMRKTNTAIENDFVMVYWEQRGAGKSYSKDIPTESINLEQFISDTKELSETLAKRFDKEKIYLMGHSWGSLLGILTAYKYPKLFHAYIGTGQVAEQRRAEKISFEWVKAEAERQNDQDAIEALSEISFPARDAASDEWLDFLMVERNYVGQFGGGVTHEMRSMLPVLKILLNAEEYTLGEKVNYLRGSLFSLENLWGDVLSKNLFTEIDSMQVPVYIFQGKYDYQTPYSVAKEFYDQLKAPEKAFYTFENSAHSPVMEEVEKFNSLLLEVTEIE